jgi:hypothetical protein
MSLDNLVKVTIFLSDRRYALENRQIRREVLGPRAVALTVIITGMFDAAWLLQIEAVAAASDARQFGGNRIRICIFTSCGK